MSSRPRRIGEQFRGGRRENVEVSHWDEVARRRGMIPAEGERGKETPEPDVASGKETRTMEGPSEVSSRNSRGRSRESLDPSLASHPPAHIPGGKRNFFGDVCRGVFTHPELSAAAVIQLQEISLDGGAPLSSAAHDSMARWRLPGNGDAVVLGATLFGDQQRRSGCWKCVRRDGLTALRVTVAVSVETRGNKLDLIMSFEYAPISRLRAQNQFQRR